MKLLLDGLKKHGIGRRAMGEEDFWKICTEDDIEVFWSRRRFPMYFTVPADDLRAIILPKRLNGSRLLFVMFHELAHHWLHGGDEPCVAFLGGSDVKCEAEADAIALIALMPGPELHVEITGDDRRFMQKLWHDRQRLSFLYGV
jgi:Zn-dependent peptidase ImmA (M78 family)